jgi:putative tricarboxylic transport membrane protein
MFDLIGNLGLGFATALSPVNLALCFLGCLVGTLIGVLPGVGPIAIAMLLPLTFKVDPTGALIMLAGIYYGAQYGGSTTAILVNIPGEATSVVTTLDGHAMARKGEAGIALGIAAMASFFAGTVATLVIAGIGAPLTKLALLFGPAEYFGLMVLATGCRAGATPDARNCRAVRPYRLRGAALDPDPEGGRRPGYPVTRTA